MFPTTPTRVRPSVCKAVVPVAGLGTRLRPLTCAFPKELLPVGREPVLAHVVAELRAAGITEALFVVSERKPQIRSYLGDLYTGSDASLPPLRCDYVVQHEQRGSGDAVLCAREWTGEEPFVVAFGDCLIESAAPVAPLRRLIETFETQQADAAILVEAVSLDRVSRYGVVSPRDRSQSVVGVPFEIDDIVEKPSAEQAPSNLVVAARWILSPSIYTELSRRNLDPRGEINIPDSLRVLLRNDAHIWVVPLNEDEARRDIGSFESYFAEFVRIALNDRDYGAQARGVAQAILSRDWNIQ